MNLFRTRTVGQALHDTSSGDLIVTPIEAAAGRAQTPIEKLTVSNLSREGGTPLPVLVQRVATELYREELRKGAWALDIGLLGSQLFVPAVMDEIRAQDGNFWRIEKAGKN